MASKSIDSVCVLSRPESFGPTKQSFEIKNGSKKNVTLYLERLGSENFTIPAPFEKLNMKPGGSTRVQVEFHPPEKGFAFSLSANYKAVIKVWALEGAKVKKKELVDIIDLSGTAPGLVALDSTKCFDPIGASKQLSARRRKK